ncbi:putative nucleotidyltransferase, ribonuclease H [Tanacetum coccineum]
MHCSIRRKKWTTQISPWRNTSESKKKKLEDIVFDNTLTTIPSEPTVCPPNENKVDFRISLEEFDDEDYTVIFDENSFSYKIISINDLKTDSENDNMPLSPNLTVDYLDDLDYFKDFENEFPAIVYNNGLTSKSDLEINPLVSSERIDKFNLIDEASLSEYDEEIVSRFNDLFNIIHPDDSKSEKDNDIGKHKHEEIEIFIKEFRTTNELLLKTRSNLLSELKIEVNELSKVVSNILIPKNEVKGVTTRGGKMMSQATRSKKINETRINKNEPLRFEQDVQEKPHDDGVENKSSTLVKIPKYAKYLKSLLTNKSKLEEAYTETMNERCSAVLLDELPLKEKDPGSFIIPCRVLEKHKETEDLVADHSSRLENPHKEVLAEREIADEFFDKHLMTLKSKSNNDEPWFFSQVKTYFWEEPYAFKLYADNIMRRCVAGSETLKILAYCHSGPTSGHHSANVTVKKVYESRFYWPSVFKDANEYVRRCDACQRSRNISSRNKMPQNNIQVCEVFDVWGLDFIGPFLESRGNKYILVAVDYVSKWVKAQALPTNDARVVVKFLRSLFSRFGVSKALISDRGTHFCNSQFEKALQRYGVTRKLSIAYHPQSNGETEVTNRAIKRILERSVGYNPKGWSKKLNDASWAFRTAYKTPTGCTPFKLVYGKACHLPVEIEHKAHWALKQCNMDLTLAGESRLMQLNELAELRDGAYENTIIYKERTKKWHDSRLRSDKDFKVGDQVLLYNCRLKMYPGKLKSKWSGPNIVKMVYPHGAIEITNRDRFSFKVNGQRLKKYYGGNIDKDDDEVLELEKGVT